MRWIWIDKFTEFTSKTSATAVKNVSLAEEHLHDLYPAFPIVPHSLIVEGMAQTAGILVGEARNFQEKVILAKIGKARFERLVRPGEQLVYAAKIVHVTEQGAAIEGTITSRTAGGEVAVGVVDHSKSEAGCILPRTGRFRCTAARRKSARTCARR